MGSLRCARGLGGPPSPMTHRRHHRHPVIHVSAHGPTSPSDVASADRRKKGNWVLNILRVNSILAEERAHAPSPPDPDPDTCTCPVDSDTESDTAFDRRSFSKLLRRVSIVELEVYAKMSYLGFIAYHIPNIKPISLQKHYGLRFVTSSLEKKAENVGAEEEQTSELIMKRKERGENTQRFFTSAAYHTIASAASFSFLQSRKNDSCEVGEFGGDDMASFVATTNSVTAVVAAKEEAKEAVAKDLNSVHSSPSEWFVCDDDESNTRYFVIQGSESMASWQANLLFEPIQFEGTDVLVHRGIYEAAKGIYQQMLPEVRSHLQSRGSSATLRFTGHSLGGSLSLLVNLMLLIRKEAPISALLPVVTFGSPTIMCGGDYLLSELGLPESHVQAIAMHRDIVPRAFSCSYPDHVAKILRAVNKNFRSHPCLSKQKYLYAPMGKLLILQPEEKYSPYHDFLPPESGLYILDTSSTLLNAARTAFLNTPHPLEILSDRAAYGRKGVIHRDHDMQAYVRSVRGAFRHELKLIRIIKREHRRLLWQPLVTSEGIRYTTAVSTQNRVVEMRMYGFGDKAKIFASKSVRVLVLLLLPVRLMIVGTLSLIRLGRVRLAFVIS